jgi:hypothetical protein
LESINLIVVNHDISFQNFEKTCNDFISLRTNGSLKMLENACSHYLVFIDMLFIFQKNLKGEVITNTSCRKRDAHNLDLSI